MCNVLTHENQIVMANITHYTTKKLVCKLLMEKKIKKIKNNNILIYTKYDV